MKCGVVMAVLVACATVATLCPRDAIAQSRMEPHRAARIEAACANATASDWGHFVIGGTMAAVGALGYLPNLLESSAGRPAVTQLGAGLGLGTFAGGVILMLRPYSAGAVRLVDTCEQLAGPRRGNATMLRDAERYLNLVAAAQRDWALRVGIVAGGITVLGVVLSNVIPPDPHDRFFWSGVFLAIPLAIWLDLLAPPPPVRASLRFQHSVTIGSIAPVPLEHGGGFAIAGTF